jgi:hypothetical protein
MSLRIGIDIDGVLADFRTAFHQAAKRCLGRDVSDGAGGSSPQVLEQREIKRVWDYVAKTPNWWLDLPAYEPEEIARLYSVARASGWEVFFLTNRPASGGDTVQFQTQWWLERHGFYLPAVLTVPGSRGEVANGLRLDLVVDDLVMNCVDVVAASAAKAVLLMRDGDEPGRAHAIDRGIGVVATFAEALVVLERLHDLLPGRRGRLMRLGDWFMPAGPDRRLPHNPRVTRPLPASISDAGGT